MKRFTETSKWDDVWFRSLSPSEKLLFIYVIDRCNNAGFLELDEEAIQFHTKLSALEIQGAIKGLARGIKGASGWLWVKNFLRHQKNETLNPENPAHKQIMGLIRDQSERFQDVEDFPKQAPCKGLQSPIGIGTGKGKERESAERERFKKPSRDEAHAYAVEIGMAPASNVDGWYDHFESNGWKVGGKSPMKDWQAALRNAKKNVRNGSTTPAKPVPYQPDTDGYCYDSLGKKFKMV